MEIIWILFCISSVPLPRPSRPSRRSESPKRSSSSSRRRRERREAPEEVHRRGFHPEVEAIHSALFSRDDDSRPMFTNTKDVRHAGNIRLWKEGVKLCIKLCVSFLGYSILNIVFNYRCVNTNIWRRKVILHRLSSACGRSFIIIHVFWFWAMPAGWVKTKHMKLLPQADARWCRQIACMLPWVPVDSGLPVSNSFIY